MSGRVEDGSDAVETIGRVSASAGGRIIKIEHSHSQVGKVDTSCDRVVGDEDVSVDELALPVVGLPLDGEAHASDHGRNVRCLRDETTLSVKDRTGEVETWMGGEDVSDGRPVY